MNRIIKFRGKSVDNGEWVYGYYYERQQLYGHHAIIIEEYEQDDDSKQREVHVIRDSVGQYTGFIDNKKIDIYEGDIVIAIENAIDENFIKTGEVWSKTKAEVFWDNAIGGWALRSDEYETGSAPISHLDTFHIIGNIYEHPTLINK